MHSAKYLQRNFVEAAKLFKQCFDLYPGTAVTKNDYATLRALYELPAGDLYTTLGR